MSEPEGVDKPFNRALPVVYSSVELELKHFEFAGAPFLLIQMGDRPDEPTTLSAKEAREVGLVMLRWAAEQGETLVWATLPAHLHDDAKKSGLVSILKKSGTFTLEEVEREAILNALALTDGRQNEAAKLLGCSLRKMNYRVKEYRKAGLLK